ncbi:MAG: hypothetical protein A2X86_22205 [Bdellovibrionales bacterium GWA2_49_15]|nr:MAG: hypothetical protein A2X86_22205 [Bdellovibrionales bacterium GWA2_49_15]HAZ14808.1 hypothetical protein [Bdellovibrionales bacterium]
MARSLRTLILPLAAMTMSWSSLAANYQTYDLETFLAEFEADSVKVLDQLPAKIDHQPLKSVAPFATVDVSTREFIEAKDKRRKDSCKNIDGVRVCLSDLEGRAAISANDRAEDLVDNGTTLINTLEQMESKTLRNGRLTRQPWSDDYWAIAKGILGARYADPNKANTLDWKEALGFVETLPATTYVEKNNQDMLSPSEKYDLLVGDRNFQLTEAMWNEGREYYEQSGKVEPWMGICHGWAPAAYMVQRAKKPVSVVTPEGTKVTFYPADIKALSSLLWAKNETETRFVGGRCNTKDPKRDANGRVLEQDCFDSNPGTWHKTIVNQIGVSNRSFVMDATFDYEVWNQPVVSYSYKYFNPETKRAASTLAQARVLMNDYRSDKFKKYRAKEARSVVGIEMEVEYVVETQPAQRNVDSPDYDATTSAVYRYDLELDQNGVIIGGEWYTNIHPDFAWTPVKNAKARSQADRYATGTWVAGQAVPGQWQKVAAQASKAGIPLAKVVEELVKQAQ